LRTIAEPSETLAAAEETAPNYPSPQKNHPQILVTIGRASSQEEPMGWAGEIKAGALAGVRQWRSGGSTALALPVSPWSGAPQDVILIRFQISNPSSSSSLS
jgi:hypothetical protein